MKITVLALEGVFDTGLATVLDAFSTANELAAMHGAGPVPFQVTIGGVRPEVRSSHKFQVPVRLLRDCPPPDLVIVPAIAYKMPGELVEALGRDDVAEAGEALRG